MNASAPAQPTTKLFQALRYWVGVLTYRYRGWSFDLLGASLFFSKGETFTYLPVEVPEGRRALYDLACEIIDSWDSGARPFDNPEERCCCGNRLETDSDGICEPCWERWERSNLTDQ